MGRPECILVDQDFWQSEMLLQTSYSSTVYVIHLKWIIFLTNVEIFSNQENLLKEMQICLFE